MGVADYNLLTPLIAFALWGAVPILFLFFARAGAMAGGKRAINTFKPVGDTDTLDAFSRAHMNTLENLPIFAVVYLAAIWTHAEVPILTLGWVILGARIAQSGVHLLNRSPMGVRVRALLFAVQVICFIWLGVQALRVTLAA